jgi:hypothetical protein
MLSVGEISGSRGDEIARGLLTTLVVEAASTPDTWVNSYHTTRRDNPEDSHLQH